GAATVGYLNAAPGVGALVGSLLTGHVGRVRKVGRAVVICVVAWGAAITGFGLVPWLPAALVLLAVAGAADVISSVFRMVIVQQVTPDGMQGRVNSLIFAGIQGGPRLGDAEAGAAAALAGPPVGPRAGGLARGAAPGGARRGAAGGGRTGLARPGTDHPYPPKLPHGISTGRRGKPGYCPCAGIRVLP